MLTVARRLTYNAQRKPFDMSIAVAVVARLIVGPIADLTTGQSSRFSLGREMMTNVNLVLVKRYHFYYEHFKILDYYIFLPLLLFLKCK